MTGFNAWTGLVVKTWEESEMSVFDRRTGMPVDIFVEMSSTLPNDTQCVHLKEGRFIAADCKEKITPHCACEGGCNMFSFS